MSTPAVTAKAFTGLADFGGNAPACSVACADALPTFSLDLVRLVTRYLVTCPHARTYGVKELQDAYGKDALEAAAQGPVRELPMPDELEAFFRKDLSQVFSASACACWAGKTKVNEVFCAYFKPQNLSIDGFERLVQQACGIKFSDLPGTQDILRGIRRSVEKEASWIAFPDEPLAQELALVAAEGAAVELIEGCQIPALADASYCIFTKYACTRTPIYPYCHELNLRSYTVVVVNGKREHAVAFEEGGLRIHGDLMLRESPSFKIAKIAPTMKVTVIPSKAS